MFKAIVALVLVASSSVCLATSSSTKTIGQIELRGDLLLISTSDGQGWNTTEGCESGNGNSSIAVLKTHPSFSEIYSTILAARVAQLPISFWVSGCHTWSSHSYAKVATLYVRNG